MTQTFFLDIDGVLVEHNGDLSKQMEPTNVLPETISLINQIEKNGGKIILTTGRKESMRKITEDILTNFGIFWDHLIMGCNRGSRILVNDLKPNSNLRTAYAFTPERNKLNSLEIEKILKPCEERPWGNFSTLAYSNKYHIKEILVKPNCSSSLQSHEHRDELWLVLEGEGEYVLDDEVIKIYAGSVCTVKKQQKHRVRNTGSINLLFIEIQSGDKFSEEDITRYEDQFGRV